MTTSIKYNNVTKIKPIDWATIDTLIFHLPTAFSDQQIELHALSEQIIELRETYCTGTEHWRDTNAEGQTPKLYIIHHINTNCPLHGRPEPGKRIRTYIGSKREKIAAAQAAIERGQQYETAMAELKRKHQDIERGAYNLHQIYWALRLDLPIKSNRQEENHDSA
ncbi:hypothetical protein ES703_79210 [subsurface metagenome]